MRPPAHRPTIGFLVDTLLSAYQQAIWQSVVEEAAAQDVNLLCFIAGRFGAGYRSLAHDLVGPGVVDALIVVSSTVGAYLTNRGMLEELRPFAPVPLVSIGAPVPGTATLMVDCGGLRQVVDHLVQVHDRRRIAFIRGPTQHAEAQARFEAYLDGLRRNGIAYDPSLVFVGDFDRTAGTRAVQTLLDERAATFDALVSASDYMAIYAMQELRRRGIRVPEDVAVTGFDDIKDASCTEPQLTTVRQPLAELGRIAVRRALASLQGQRGPELSRYPSAFVPRRSCGCPPGPRTAGAGPGFPEDGAEGADQLDASAWTRDLSAALKLLPDLGARPFLEVLDRLLAVSFARGLPAADWHEVLDDLLRAGPPERTGELEALRRTAARLVTSRSEQALTSRLVRTEEQFDLLQRIAEMGHSHEMDLWEILRAELPKLGIRRFFLFSYRDQRRQEAVPCFQLPAGAAAGLDRSPAAFPARDLVPGRLPADVRHALAVLPIHAHDRAEHWGFAVCELADVVPIAYETLAVHVGTAIKVAGLLAREREHADTLEATVEQRTRELREAQARLLDPAGQGAAHSPSVKADDE